MSKSIEKINSVVGSLDPLLIDRTISWYLEPGIEFINNGPIDSSVFGLPLVEDESWEQPVASTGELRRLMSEDGNSVIVLSLDSDHSLFYAGTPLAQALVLATEQAMGSQQTEEVVVSSGVLYKGIGVLSRLNDDWVIKPYELGMEVAVGEKVVSAMAELNPDITLALVVFRLLGGLEIPEGVVYESSDLQARKIVGDFRNSYWDLARRGSMIREEVPDFVQERFAGFDHFKEIATEKSVKAFAEAGLATSWAAEHFLEKAEELFAQDKELVELIENLSVERWHGDIRGVNLVDDRLIDSLSLLIKRNKAVGDEYVRDGKIIDIEPWSISIPHYAMAFQLVEQLAMGLGREVTDSVVRRYAGEYHKELENIEWNDVNSVQMRLLMLCVAIKAIESAQIATFHWKKDGLSDIAEDYMQFSIERFPLVAVDLIDRILGYFEE